MINSKCPNCLHDFAVTEHVYLLEVADAENVFRGVYVPLAGAQFGALKHIERINRLKGEPIASVQSACDAFWRAWETPQRMPIDEVFKAWLSASDSHRLLITRLEVDP